MTTYHDIRRGGDHIIHRTDLPPVLSTERAALCGHVVRHISSHPREWSGGGLTVLTDCPQCTTIEREATMPTTREVRGNANDIIHLTTSPPESGHTMVPTVCGHTLDWAVDYDAREWRGGPGVTLSECTICFGTRPDVGTEVDIHPLTFDKMQQHQRFTLHSKPGRRDGREVVFGCQRFLISDLVDAGATLSITPTEVTVVIEATPSRGADVRVLGRLIGRADVNAYTTKITATPPPPDPDARVKEVLHACGIGDGEALLVNLRDRGFDVVAKVQS